VVPAAKITLCRQGIGAPAQVPRPTVLCGLAGPLKILIAVPSRGLETGPLVALEAFAAGVPVLGANLGGIAELVQSGIDGFLVPPDDVAALAAAIARFEENPHLVCEMRGRITTPRSMEGVVDDMATVYSAIVTESAVSIDAA
jgi:hypothetical protein